MKHLTVQAPAKINWYIDIGKKRSDGYHDIRTVMQTVELYDTLQFGKTDSKEITMSVDGMSCGVPCDERNIVYRAAKALGVYGIDIRLTKRIPSQAGLGGGSSDAGSTLVALNSLFELGRSKAELAKIAATIGSDVPFFVYGGAGIVSGMGEEVTPLCPVTRYKMALVKYSEGLSTKDVFNEFDRCEVEPKITLDEFLSHFNNDDENLHEYLYNALEPAALRLCPSVEMAKAELQKCGAVKTMMSGSGTAVFGLFNDKTVYESAAENADNIDFWTI